MKVSFKRSTARETSEEKPKPNRAVRRSRPPAPSVRQQRFASLCAQVAMEMRPHDGEMQVHYFRRVRNAAARVEHEQRTARRSAARTARKRNR